MSRRGNKQDSGMRRALIEFVKTINATGGVVLFNDGNVAPAGDTEWTDLGDAYLSACAALGREPKVIRRSEYENPLFESIYGEPT